jgi:hypothetical protein
MKYEIENMKGITGGLAASASTHNLCWVKLRPLVLFSYFIFLISYLATTAFSQTISVTPPDKGKPKVLEITPALRDYCKLLYACGLQVPAGACPALLELGPPAPFGPSSERCLEAKELESRGLRADHPEYGFRLYRFLGFEYRVVYSIPDTLPISRARFEFLLGDIPLAAKLISHYMKTPYEAQYTNFERTHFKGSKGPRLRGEARLISGGFTEGRLIYIGSGVAEVAFWTLVGPAMMDFRYRVLPVNGKTAEKVVYDLKVVVFPGNGMINSIMNMGLFRNVVTSKVQDVLKDITETAKLLEADQGKQLLKNPQWSTAERKKIEALLKLK